MPISTSCNEQENLVYYVFNKKKDLDGKYGIDGSHADVTGGNQVDAAANARAVNGGDNWFRTLEMQGSWTGTAGGANLFRTRHTPLKLIDRRS